MPNFNGWWGANRISRVNAERRAVLCWKRIQDKPSSVVFYDPATEAAIGVGAQTVRLEYEDDGRVVENMAEGQSPKRMLTVIGVRDHPTVTDTDVAEGYRFKVDGLNYRVMDVIRVPGEVQATAERYDGS